MEAPSGGNAMVAVVVVLGIDVVATGLVGWGKAAGGYKRAALANGFVAAYLVGRCSGYIVVAGTVVMADMFVYVEAVCMGLLVG